MLRYFAYFSMIVAYVTAIFLVLPLTIIKGIVAGIRVTWNDIVL